MAATLAGAKKASLCQAFVCVVENVVGCRRAYGPCFQWCQRVVQPEDVGFEFIARERTANLMSVSLRHVQIAVSV